MNDTHCNFPPLLLQSLKTDILLLLYFVTVEPYNTTIQSIRQHVSAYSQPSSSLISSRTIKKKKNQTAADTKFNTIKKIIKKYK